MQRMQRDQGEANDLSLLECCFDLDLVEISEKGKRQGKMLVFIA